MSDTVEQTGGTTGAPVTPESTPQKTVAYDNFQAVVSAKIGLEAQVKELRAQVQSLTERAATADTLGQELASWKQKAEAESQRYGAYVELSGAVGSTDPDVLAAFDARYNGLPKTDRPDRKAWVEGLRAAPDQAPALLRPWLGATPVAPPKPPAPRVPGTPATPPGAPSSVSAEEVARVREEAVRTGDWSKWKAMRVSMGLVK